jgi:hypothetical protein
MIGLNRGLVSDPAAPFGGMKQSGIGREGAQWQMRPWHWASIGPPNPQALELYRRRRALTHGWIPTFGAAIPRLAVSKSLLFPTGILAVNGGFRGDHTWLHGSARPIDRKFAAEFPVTMLRRVRT